MIVQDIGCWLIRIAVKVKICLDWLRAVLVGEPPSFRGLLEGLSRGLSLPHSCQGRTWYRLPTYSGWRQGESLSRLTPSSPNRRAPVFQGILWGIAVGLSFLHSHQDRTRYRLFTWVHSLYLKRHGNKRICISYWMLHSFPCNIASGGKHIAQWYCSRSGWRLGAGVSIDCFSRGLFDCNVFLWDKDELIHIS